jgi:hypothetical protein
MTSNSDKSVMRYFPAKELGDELLAWFRERCHRQDLMRSCLTCQHFDETRELCKPAQLRPPARVIANGCPKYDDIYDIPF